VIDEAQGRIDMSRIYFGRLFATGAILFLIVALSSGCVATRKFVRGEVGSTADTLNAKIDKTDSNLKETNDRVSTLDTRTNEQGRKLDSVSTDLQKTNMDLQKTTERTSQAQSAAQSAQTTADQARGRVVTLEENFANRNQYTVVTEKSILFQFDSAKLDPTYASMLDEIAQMVAQHKDALVVLEGRTDSKGSEAYNVQLGQRRAETVKRYLVVEKNVQMYRIHETSFGAAHPIADNNSKEGREKNRTVAVSVLVPQMSTASASNPSK
jgi:outer membrane protein OmpA-like peptidoglycan-associated protein